MLLKPPPMFGHRYNRNGSINSYCRRCLVQVSISTSLAELEAKELEHRCNPRLLKRVDRFVEVTHFRQVA